MKKIVIIFLLAAVSYYGYQNWKPNDGNILVDAEVGAGAPSDAQCDIFANQCFDSDGSDDSVCVPFATQCLSRGIVNNDFCRNGDTPTEIARDCFDGNDVDMVEADSCIDLNDLNCIIFGTNARNRVNPTFIAQCNQLTDACLKNRNNASCTPFIDTCLTTAVKTTNACAGNDGIEDDFESCGAGIFGSCQGIADAGCFIYGTAQ